MEFQPDEILNIILHSLTFRELGRLRQCNRRLYNLIEPQLNCEESDRVRRRRISALRRYNPMLELLHKIQDHVDWKFVSSSKYIHWDVIVQNPDMQWDWGHVSINPNITPDIVSENPRRPWDQYMLMRNPNTRPETCGEQLRKKDMLIALSTNPNLTFDFILNNINLNWSWSQLSENETIACTANILNCPDLPWDWHVISKHVSREVFVAHIAKRWNWRLISARPFVTMEFIKQYFRLKWDWDTVIANPSITWDDVIANPQFPWRLWKFSANPNLTDQILHKYPTVSWSNFQMSMNTSINMKIIRLMGHQYAWNVLELSLNTGITIDIIRYFDRTDLLSWDNLSVNPAITHKIIMENPDLNWIPHKLLKNPNIEPEMILEYLYLRERVISKCSVHLTTSLAMSSSNQSAPSLLAKKLKSNFGKFIDKFTQN